MPPSTFIIGIAGGTASGKTTLANNLLTIGGSEKVAVVGLDRYYRTQDGIPPDQRALVNYDHPDALEYELLITHLNSIQHGDSIEAPVYDFATHCRDPHHTTHVDAKECIVIEGILAFAHPELVKLFDLKVFVDTPESIRFTRRFERDTRERGRTPESVHAQWQTTVQPMHLEFCEPSRAVADLIINGHTDLASTAQSLWSTVSERARGRGIAVA